MSKPSKIDQYFKRKNAEANTKSPNIENSQVSLTNSPNFRNPPLKAQRIETNPVITQLLERDPGLRPQIWVHDVNQRDEIRRAYIMAGPYQPRLSEYPKSGPEKHRRRFQSSWFDSFPSWLEYSPIKDAAFCLPCYLFNTPSAHPKCKAYTVNGFNVWRKVKDGKNCAFLNHVGKDPNSSHKKAEKSCEDLMRQSQHLPQRNEELKRAQAADIEYMISIDELESGRGLNQIGTLQRPGDTRWSSHFRSVSNLITMFSATCSVLLNIIEDGTNAFQRGDADAAYEAMTSFEFVFILHLMKEIMAITDILCQALQSKSQDILHAMHLVSSTKALIQKFRDDGWITLLNQVKSFCEVRNIDIPEMNAQYVARQGRARRQEDNFTVAEHYRVNLFYAVIDCQLQELSSRFNEHAVQLLILSSALDPRECRESFRIGDVCQLADKFYPADFTDVDKMNLKIQLEHYEYNVVQHPEFKSLSTISDLSQWLVSTRKATIFPLVYRIIVLVLTLPVSTATTERSFSAMRIVKTRLRNKMEDEFLTDSLIMYIEREIAEKLSIESIVNEFRDMKERRIPF
ncbi:uncharacterized protein LOC107178787 isoform X4 [Citrus sinensis]|uniref:uncharacterized protein LOC107178787 isoform X4 n=1 Tax=Citrus sinensis TaxID=2711 RepID=UPI002277F64F|nr:uncharacterized protein LOC107178787 isoform X4 [Citrus sinensis]